MGPPYPTQRDLYGAIWRVDMVAAGASTAAGFLWVFGFMALIAIASLIAGIEIPPQVAGTWWTVVLVIYLAALFGGGLLLMAWSSSVMYRRFGLTCPSCGAQLDGVRKARACLASGRCPACGNPMVAKSHHATPKHKD